MMVDDAHASGVFGKNGRGTVDHFGMHGRVDIQVGTLSKAIGALGGYVAGSTALIEFLHHRARPFLFSTSHPPSVAADVPRRARRAARGAADHRAALGEHALLQGGPQSRSASTPALSESPITPVIVGDGALAMKLSDRLFEEGVFAQGIAFPTVASDKARVRTIVTATHTRDDLQFALDASPRSGASSASASAPGPSWPRSRRPSRRNRRRSPAHRCPWCASGNSSRPTLEICAPTTSSASSRARRRRPGSCSPARSRPRRSRDLPWHIRAAEYTRARVSGLHAAALAGAARDLRHRRSDGVHRA